MMKKTLLLILCLLILIETAQAMTMSEAVNKAISNNPQIAQSQTEVKAAQAKVREIQSKRNPNISFTAVLAGMDKAPSMELPEMHMNLGPLGERTLALPSLPLSNETISTGAFSLTVPITTGGRIENGIRQAKAGEAATILKYEAVKKETAFQTVKAYLTAILAEKIENANSFAYDTVNEHVITANKLFEQRQIAKYELFRAETELANAKKRLVDSQNNRKLAVAVLKTIMGEPDSDDMALDSSIYEATILEISTDEKNALENSEILKALSAKDEMYKSAEKLAHSEHMPILAGFASRIVYSNDQPFTTPKHIAGLMLSVPLYDGGTSSAKAQEQSALALGNKYERLKTENNIKLEIIKYTLEMQTAQESLKANEKSIETAKEALRLAKRRFEEGVGTGIEVSDASLSLLTTETNQFMSLYQYKSAYYCLAKYSERFWEILGVSENSL